MALSRRQLLRTSFVVGAGALLAACGATPTATPLPPTPTTAAAAKPTSAPTAVPTVAVGSKKMTIRWATGASGATDPMGIISRSICAKFMADFPNITVEQEETAGNDHQTKIKLDASSDRLPDAFTYWRLDPVFGLDQIVNAGKIADLTDWTKTDPYFKDLFDDGAWKTASLSGKVYGVPRTMFYVQFVANKEVLDRAGVKLPSTWDELVAAVQTLSTKGELPWGANNKLDSHAQRIYNQVINRMVGNARALNMHAGKEPYNVPEIVNAAKLLQTLVIGKMPPDASALDQQAVIAKYINTGKAAFVIDGSFEIPLLDKAVQEKMVVLEFPLVPGGSQTEKNVERDLTNLVYVNGKSWSDPDRQPVVKELIKRFTSRDAGKRYSEEAQQPVPMRGVSLDPAKVGHLAVEGQKLAVERPQNKWIPSVMSPDVRAKYDPIVAEFLGGKYTPEKFVEETGKILMGA